MKTWDYKEEKLSVNQLMKLPECIVTEVELRINLSKKKMDADKAIVTKAQFKRRSNSKLYPMHGLMLTPHEISDLKCCEVSYWKLMQNLRKGHPINEAILKAPKPLVRKKVKECSKTSFTSRLEELGSPYNKAQGGSIKLLDQERCHYPIELSWEFQAAKKLSRVLERRMYEVDRAKQLNEEDESRSN